MEEYYYLCDMKELSTPTSVVELDGVKEIKRTNYKDPETFTKMYDAKEFYSIARLLDKCDILLLFFLASQVISEDNLVDTTITTINRYRELFGRETYSVSTVKASIGRLKEFQFLLPSGFRGKYVVNPRFFFREGERIRSKVLYNTRETIAQELIKP